MKRSRQFAVVALAAAFCGPLAAQTVYHITDLGALTGTSSTANGISPNGAYVTGSFLNGSVRHGFLYNAGTAVDMGTLSGTSQGNAVNNSGLVAGTSVNTNNYAISYTGGAMTSLGTIGVGLSSFGYGVNSSGAIVGYTNVNSNFHEYHAFLYSSGAMQDLGLFGGTSSYAMGVNDTGEIVGYYVTSAGATHAFTLIGSTMADLGTLGGLSSNAAAVSSNGLVAGSSANTAGNTHAFLYSSGKMTDLGTLAGLTSRAAGINASGAVVGQSTFSGSGFHAVIYTGGQLTDLNSLLDPAQTGYVVANAVGITDSGIIAAYGTVPVTGQQHALLLTPVVSNPQTIAFDAIPDQLLGISPFPIEAQASSALPVSFTSTTPAICTTASARVMLLAVGTCSVTASQGGGSNFGAATPVVRSFVVHAAAPSGTLMAAAGSPVGAGKSPHGVAVGDFDGDGKLDVVVANFGAASVSVLLGNGAGGFTAAAGSPFATGANPTAVVVGDFNGDGRPDIATANNLSGDITVLLGNGSGGFSAATGSPFNGGSTPTFLAVGDFNQDGIQDLALANGDNTVRVLLGNGAGGFTAGPGNPTAVGTNPVCIAIGDFNGDHVQDLAIANQGSNAVTVLLGNGTGGFTAAINSPFLVHLGPTSVVVGDFNADGKQDLAIANGASNDVTVLLGDGAGGFAPATGSPFAAGAAPSALVAGDFNGDGIQDLAVVDEGGNGVSVLLGAGAGAFAVPAVGPLTAGTTPLAAAVGDFNADAVEDLAIANSATNDVTVLLGGKAPTTSTLTTGTTLPIVRGQSVGLTVAVSDTGAAFAAPSGQVTFLDGATVVGAASQSASPYSFTLSGLQVGTHTLTAAYGGDARTLSSTSNILTVKTLSRCDINRDEITDPLDVKAMVAGALLQPTAAIDLNQDGVLNVLDIQIVVNAAFGQGCSAN